VSYASPVLFWFLACATHHLGGEPEVVELDLIRPWPHADKIYVQAGLPDGTRGVFLVDTGAATSVISSNTAARLGLSGIDRGGTLAGLGGEVPWYQGELASLTLGAFTIEHIDVAVGTPGLPQAAGWIPIDGILGNNVWGQFVVAIDYPADVLELARPGALPLPEDATPMAFDGRHVVVPAVLHAEDGDLRAEKKLLLELDTGARRVLLSGATGAGFEPLAQEGEEPIYGIGAADVPFSSFYRRTRRVPLASVEIGGASIEDPGDAVWINYEDAAPVGPLAMLGLLGHAVLSDHRVILDFPGSRFALVDSTREPRALDGHEVLYDQDLVAYGDDPERGLFRARMLLALERWNEALQALDDYLARHPDEQEALVTRARILRFLGDLDGYDAVVDALAPEALVDRAELLGVVNGQLLAGRVDEAVALADAALTSRPDDPGAHLAQADVLYQEGRIDEARAAIQDASRVREDPDAFLLRRARLSMAEGDGYAALAHLRRRIQLYPSDGQALWFYGLVAAELDDRGVMTTLQHDIERSVARLHADARPLDFELALWHLLGDEARVKELLARGLERDCSEIDDHASAKNCEAWYRALAHEDLDAALAAIETAVHDEPNRPDYLDTLAMVLSARGDAVGAAEAARSAARFAPDDLYHVWQAERLSRLAEPAPG